MAASKYITATRIYQHLQCPHWAYYDWHATEEQKQYRRETTPGERERWEDGVAHERDFVEGISQGAHVVSIQDITDPDAAFAETVEAMRRGAEWIYQGTLIKDDLLGKPDLLLRRDGQSQFGPWEYVPVDVKSSHDLQKYQRLQLTLYAQLLSAAQGTDVKEAAIANREGVCIWFDPASFMQETDEVVDALRAIRDGHKPDPVLRKACFDTGVWGELCKKDAEDTDDIALLYNVDVKRLAALRQLGVRTVAEAAEMDVEALEGAAKGLTLHGLEVAKLQAQSLKRQQVIIREPILVEPQGLEIHFDIESDPPNDLDYLYGILIRRPEGDEYRAFVSRTLEGEEQMWHEFIDWIASLPPVYTVYHFAPYEKTRLDVLENRYGRNEWLDKFRSRMVDLKESLRHTVTLPLYFYGLKHIAKFLGFKWRSSVTSGGASVDAFERYIKTGDEAIMDAIILYNEDDVRGTAFLRDWLSKYAGEVGVYEPSYPWKSE